MPNNLTDCYVVLFLKIADILLIKVFAFVVIVVFATQSVLHIRTIDIFIKLIVVPLDVIGYDFVVSLHAQLFGFKRCFDSFYQTQGWLEVHSVDLVNIMNTLAIEFEVCDFIDDSLEERSVENNVLIPRLVSLLF